MVTVSDVLVVGAGPVGLTTACQLARLGVPVRVVEALERPTTESRAVGVHARSMEMLAALGVLPRLEARGRRIARPRHARRPRPGRRGRASTLAGVPSRHPYVLDVPQPDTEAVLAERAAELGVVVERGRRADRRWPRTPTASRSPCGPATGSRPRASGWVVGADGGHSTTRAPRGHAPGGRLPRPALRHGRRRRRHPVPPGHHPDVHPPRRHGDPVPAGGRAAPGSCSSSTPPGADAGDPTLEQIQALADARMGGQVTVRNPRWLTYFEVHHAQVPRLPPRAGPPRGRRRPHPQPGRGAGHEHRHPGRRQPRLEARAGRAGPGGRGTARHLPRRAAPGRGRGRPHDHDDDRRRHGHGPGGRDPQRSPCSSSATSTGSGPPPPRRWPS